FQRPGAEAEVVDDPLRDRDPKTEPSALDLAADFGDPRRRLGERHPALASWRKLGARERDLLLRRPELLDRLLLRATDFLGAGVTRPKRLERRDLGGPDEAEPTGEREEEADLGRVRIPRERIAVDFAEEPLAPGEVEPVVAEPREVMRVGLRPEPRG